MDWRDEGILLAVRAHGESSAIIETLTRDHGRHAGLVRGGKSAKLAPMMQPGTQLALEWRARLAEQWALFIRAPDLAPGLRERLADRGFVERDEFTVLARRTTRPVRMSELAPATGVQT